MKAGRCHYCGLGFVQVRDEWPSSPQFEQRWGVRVLTVPAKSCSSSRSISSRFEISSFAHAILASSMATPSLLAGVEKWFRALSPYWDLTECVSKDACPLDANTKNNLRFLIGLRHQVEHKKADGLDSYLSARHQARAYRPPSSRALAQVAARHRRRRCATPIPLRARPSCRRVRFHDRSTPAPTGGSRHRSDSGRSHWHQLMSSRLSSRRFASRAIPASVSAKVFAFPVVDGAANTSFGYVGANAGAVFRSTPQAFAAYPANA